MALGADVTMTPAVIQRQTNGMYVPSGQTLAIDGTLEIGGTAITATAAEINAIAGGGLSDTELGVLNGVTAGTATASKALVIGASKEIATITSATITTVTTGAIAAVDASLGVDGLAAAQGGAIVATGGTSSTAGNAGGAVSLVGGTPGSTGVGGAVSITAAAGGSASGKGGSATVAGGAGTAGNGAGGSAIVTGGAKHGSGLDGGVFMRSASAKLFRSQVVSTAETDAANAVAAADFINGICVHTVAQARTLTTPTGAEILAVCPSDIAAGDSFDFTVITVGTGADDISTLTAGDADVTFVGPVTVGGTTGHGGTGDVGTWRFRYTGANAFVGYRIA